MAGEYPSADAIRMALSERLPEKMVRRLAASRVAIAGLGGLGSHIAVALVRSGVGMLHLIDYDQVALGNLNRQAYKLKHVGMPKTEALAAELREINPYVQLLLDEIQVTEDNLLEVFAQDTLVCEAFDGAEQKAMLVNGLLSGRSDVTIVSGSGMAGCGTSNSIRTKRIMQRLYLCGDGHSDVAKGDCLMAPRVAVCANHQANMALRLLLGMHEV